MRIVEYINKCDLKENASFMVKKIIPGKAETILYKGTVKGAKLLFADSTYKVKAVVKKRQIIFVE